MPWWGSLEAKQSLLPGASAKGFLRVSLALQAADCCAQFAGLSSTSTPAAGRLSLAAASDVAALHLLCWTRCCLRRIPAVAQSSRLLCVAGRCCLAWHYSGALSPARGQYLTSLSLASLASGKHACKIHHVSRNFPSTLASAIASAHLRCLMQ